MQNKVFIATSLDGYIADLNGGIEWLTEIPNPTGHDGGFADFMNSVDALIMGRNTFEKVLSFGIEWPYSKKVFVWSNSLKEVPTSLIEKVQLVRGNLNDVVKFVQQQNCKNIYVDGGKTIQSFLNQNLIHEIVLTQVPVILGSGIPLFKDVPTQKLKLLSVKAFDNGMIQIHYNVLS